MITHKSSRLTFVYQYIFPVAVPLFCAFLLYTMWDFNEETKSFFYVFLATFTWVMIFLIQMPFKLKPITATDQGITIHHRNEDEAISYQAVTSVSRYDLTNPWMMTIAYQDRGEQRKINYMPQQRAFKMSDELTDFIKAKSQAANPQYQEVSSMKNYLKLLLFSLPVMLVVLYHMLPIFQQ